MQKILDNMPIYDYFFLLLQNCLIRCPGCPTKNYFGSLPCRKGGNQIPKDFFMNSPFKEPKSRLWNALSKTRKLNSPRVRLSEWVTRYLYKTVSQNTMHNYREIKVILSIEGKLFLTSRASVLFKIHFHKTWFSTQMRHVLWATI